MPQRRSKDVEALLREYLRELGSRGGKAAAQRMTKAQRVERATKAATARPAEERRESARNAARARWASPTAKRKRAEREKHG